MATRGFKYDIFISYAHADDATSSGWLKRFLDDLKKELGARLGRGVNIFFDEMHFSANDELISRTLASLQGSAIFMPVVSLAYLKSDWAKAELAAYVELNGSRQILPIETAAPNKENCPMRLLIGNDFAFGHAMITELFSARKTTLSTINSCNK